MIALLIVRFISTTAEYLPLIIIFQGAIGILDRTDMDHFADIFMAYQKRGKAEDSEGKASSSQLQMQYADPRLLRPL